MTSGSFSWLVASERSNFLQFWLEMYTRPSDEELETLEQAIGSWFIVGKLGGFNSTNLQV